MPRHTPAPWRGHATAPAVVVASDGSAVAAVGGHAEAVATRRRGWLRASTSATHPSTCRWRRAHHGKPTAGGWGARASPPRRGTAHRRSSLRRRAGEQPWRVSSALRCPRGPRGADHGGGPLVWVATGALSRPPAGRRSARVPLEWIPPRGGRAHANDDKHNPGHRAGARLEPPPQRRQCPTQRETGRRWESGWETAMTMGAPDSSSLHAAARPSPRNSTALRAAPTARATPAGRPSATAASRSDPSDLPGGHSGEPNRDHQRVRPPTSGGHARGNTGQGREQGAG